MEAETLKLIWDIVALVSATISLVFVLCVGYVWIKYRIDSEGGGDDSS